jgi:hypothetical protein
MDASADLLSKTKVLSALVRAGAEPDDEVAADPTRNPKYISNTPMRRFEQALVCENSVPVILKGKQFFLVHTHRTGDFLEDIWAGRAGGTVLRFYSVADVDRFLNMVVSRPDLVEVSSDGQHWTPVTSAVEWPTNLGFVARIDFPAEPKVTSQVLASFRFRVNGREPRQKPQVSIIGTGNPTVVKVTGRL